MTPAERKAARRIRQAARAADRTAKQAAMTPEATWKSFEHTEQQRRDNQRKVINAAWDRELGSTREATLSFRNADNKYVKMDLDMSLLGTSPEASFFWKGVFGTEWFAKPAALTVTDINSDGNTQQRRIMVRRNIVGSDIYPFPGEQAVVNQNPNHGVVYRAH